MFSGFYMVGGKNHRIPAFKEKKIQVQAILDQQRLIPASLLPKILETGVLELSSIIFHFPTLSFQESLFFWTLVSFPEMGRKKRNNSIIIKYGCRSKSDLQVEVIRLSKGKGGHNMLPSCMPRTMSCQPSPYFSTLKMTDWDPQKLTISKSHPRRKYWANTWPHIGENWA